MSFLEITITNPTVITVLSAIIGLFFFGVGVAMMRRALRFWRNSVKTTGEVAYVDMQQKTNSAIVIQYVVASTGRYAQFTVKFNEIPAKFQLGRRVAVKYRADNPQDAFLATFANQVGGIPFIIAGLLVLLLVVAHLFWGYQWPAQ